MLNLLAAFAGGLCLGVVCGMIAMHLWIATIEARNRKIIDRMYWAQFSAANRHEAVKRDLTHKRGSDN